MKAPADLTGKPLIDYQAHLETIAIAPALIGNKEAEMLAEAKWQLGDVETVTAKTFTVDIPTQSTKFE